MENALKGNHKNTTLNHVEDIIVTFQIREYKMKQDT